jgi:hypothetical protein
LVPAEIGSIRDFGVPDGQFIEFYRLSARRRVMRIKLGLLVALAAGLLAPEARSQGIFGDLSRGSATSSVTTAM